MTTWAQVIDGRVFNPVEVDPKTLYTIDWLDEHPAFEVVADGTQHGATMVGGDTHNPDGSIVHKDGSVTPAPEPKKPDPVPATTKQQILDQIAVLKSIADQLP